MTTPTAFPDPDEVLSQLDWVRSLAQKLVGDPAEAEDLRQEVWLLSQRLKRPGPTALRGWLGGILRNVIRDRRRAARTRTDHETRAVLDRARSLENPPLVREVSIHQVVVERLMQMREPYRSTLLARYFEDLSHAEIAEKEGVSIATVRSRLQRGLAELRSNLREEQHQNSSVLSLLALHTWGPESISLSAPATSAWMAWAVAAVAVTSAVLFLKLRDPAERVSELTRAVDESGAAIEIASAAELDRAQEQEVRQAIPVPEPAPVSTESVVLEPTGLQAQVIDLQEQPLQGIELAYMRYLPDGNRTVGEKVLTNEQGLVQIGEIEGSGMVIAASADHVQLAYPVVNESTPESEVGVVLLAPVTVLQGVVLAENGEPLQGASIKAGFLEPFPGEIGRIMAHSNQPKFDAQTDRDGRFSLRVPLCPEPMGLLCTKVGYEDGILPRLLFDREPDPIEITLPAVQDVNTCFGEVLSEDGQAIVGAWVADGDRVVRTMESGKFQLGRVPDGADLWVGALGFEPKSVPRVADLRNITLELSRPSLAIEGQAFYPDGSPAVGLQLRIRSKQAAGTYFYSYGGRRAFTPLSVEAFAYPSNGAVPGRPRTLTDDEGRFRLVGLLPRDYELELIDPNSLQKVEGLHFSAGSHGVRIECPARPDPVSGTLRTPDGKPLADVLLRAMEPLLDRPGPLTRTNAAGEFRFESLVPGCRLWADVELPWIHTGVVVEDSNTIRLEVEPAARLRVTLDMRDGFAGQERLPKRLSFRDVTGARVPFILDDIRFYRRNEIAIAAEDDGFARPVPLLVPARARELVLEDDAPVLVLPLELQAGQDLSIVE